MATLTVYPDANPESTSVDGYAQRDVTPEETLATIRAGAGTSAADVGGDTGIFCRLRAGAVSNKYDQLSRTFLLFDTSAIGSGGSVSAAVLSVYVTLKQDSASNTPTSDIFTSSPASNTAIVAADFTQVGSVSQTGAAKTYSSHTTSAYNDFTFNATGRGNINTSGVSKFSWREAKFDVGGATPSWSSGALTGFSGDGAETTGSTKDPKLVITYTAGGVAPPPRRSHRGLTLR